MDWVLVGVGSFAGGATRYVLGRAIVAQTGAAFPWHTLAINVTGSLAIGVLAALLARWEAGTGGVASSPGASTMRLLLVVGFLGGYTTFSSYSLELLTLLREGRAGAALLYGLGSSVLGLAACAAGYYAAGAVPALYALLRLSR
jgi:fluoride exporter